MDSKVNSLLKLITKIKNIPIFDLQSLNDVIVAKQQASTADGFLGKAEEKTEHEELLTEYLVIKSGGQEVACALTDIFEVVDVKDIKYQPNAPLLVEGVSLVRGVPHIVLSLAKMLEREEVQNDNAFDFRSILIVKQGQFSCGLLIDEIIGLELVSESQIRASKSGEVSAIVRSDGETVTQVLSLISLVDDELLDTISAFMPSAQATEEEIVIKKIEMLRFLINDDAYAFYIDDIRRVVADKKIEPLLEDHYFLIGTIELEGQVVPVVNLTDQLGYKNEELELKEFYCCQ